MSVWVDIPWVLTLVTWLWVSLGAALWVAVGTMTVVIVLHRHGHRESSWYLMGAVLGPLLIPLALERAQDPSRTLDHHTAPNAAGAPGREGGITVIVGVDGSPESDQAVRDVGRCLAGGADRVVLVGVVDIDTPDMAGSHQQSAAQTLLDERASWLPTDGPMVSTDIVAGAPTEVLLDVAASEDADLVVVGRRGRGMSKHLLGSVTEQLIGRSIRPVLVAAPPDRERETR
jgi:nucleotide-binding universal stress UspA family protein